MSRSQRTHSRTERRRAGHRWRPGRNLGRVGGAARRRFGDSRRQGLLRHQRGNRDGRARPLVGTARSSRIAGDYHPQPEKDRLRASTIRNGWHASWRGPGRAFRRSKVFTTFPRTRTARSSIARCAAQNICARCASWSTGLASQSSTTVRHWNFCSVPMARCPGARGIRRQAGGDWQVNAGAVVIATGGTSFLSRLLGSHTNTGDGYLMAAEAGAELSGMEFTTYYTVAPVRSTMTRSMSYAFATYYDEDGAVIPMPPGPETTRPLARAMLKGRVFCDLARTPQDIRERVPTISPNFMLPFRRWGIDPYKDRFEVTLHGEGTIRGIGGLRIVGDDCSTSVPGLFAAGDAATRELVAGAISGGGNINSAWAVSSGQWAGTGAARHASANGSRVGRARHRPGRPSSGAPRHAMSIFARRLSVVQGEMLPYDKNIFRSGQASETFGRNARRGLGGGRCTRARRRRQSVANTRNRRDAGDGALVCRVGTGARREPRHAPARRPAGDRLPLRPAHSRRRPG